MRSDYLDPELMTRRAIVAAALGAAALPLRADCRPTSRAVQGPYYRSESPLTTDLRRAGGHEIVVHGVVRGPDCRPLAGALIEVWQADHHGKYDLDYGRDEEFLRGQMRTNEAGEYSFRTIKPAAYGVSRFVRPAHIHFIVSAAGHRRLVTQLYFAGDPYLDRDPVRSVFPDLIVKEQSGKCRFDISLV